MEMRRPRHRSKISLFHGFVQRFSHFFEDWTCTKSKKHEFQAYASGRMKGLAKSFWRTMKDTTFSISVFPTTAHRARTRSDSFENRMSIPHNLTARSLKRSCKEPHLLHLKAIRAGTFALIHPEIKEEQRSVIIKWIPTLCETPINLSTSVSTVSLSVPNSSSSSITTTTRGIYPDSPGRFPAIVSLYSSILRAFACFNKANLFSINS